MGFYFMFNLVPVIMVIIFIAFFAVFIMNFIKNSKSPMINVKARVVSKRTSISTSMNNNGNMNATTNTTYYHITFETEHGERIEFSVSGRIYGMLVEGDRGELIYKGTWFRDFKRDSSIGMQEY